MRRIAVTGAGGFIGLHTVIRLAREEGVELVLIDHDDFRADRLQEMLAGVDVVIHLAGVNRGTPDEVRTGNTAIAEQLVTALAAVSPQAQVIYGSSTQRSQDNDYGKSKLEAEQLLRDHAAAHDAALTVAVVPNVFGPGCRPFYNSVVATFCHQLTHGETPQIQIDRELELIWVVDLVDALARTTLSDAPAGVVEWEPTVTHVAKVSEILATLSDLAKVHFGDRLVPELPTELDGLLYRTLVTYADPEAHEYRPTIHADDRGYLFEVVKQLAGGGQVFFSTTKPGITRGNHYHTRKYEKFCVVKGSAAIRLRRLQTDDVLEYQVSGEEPSIVDIPLFHTHSIQNTGDDELLTLFWSNELFDPIDGDTFAEQVMP